MTALKYTLEQVRERELALIGQPGPGKPARPNPWWKWDVTTADCMGFQTWCMGLRTHAGDDTPALINIDAFLAHTPWERIDVGSLRPGDLVFQNWTRNGNGYGSHPEHVEHLYSPIVAGRVTTVSANTGPAPGVPDPNGVHKKTRDLGSWLLFGVRPLYAHPATTATSSSIKRTRLIGTWLNKHLPPGCAPSAAGDIDRQHGDGIPGPRYWHNVQTWGRQNGLYGPGYIIDGIPGPRSRYVEGVIYARVKG